jgi:hypothetical protein
MKYILAPPDKGENVLVELQEEECENCGIASTQLVIDEDGNALCSKCSKK